MIKVRRIMAPTDFSEPSVEALGVAAEVAEQFEAELLLVHVLTPPPKRSEWADASKWTVPLSVQHDKESAEEALQELVDRRVSDAVQCRLIVEIGDLPDSLLDAAEREKVDLLVIATHGRTGWRRLVFGSVSEPVIRDAHCPVLTIHASRKSGARA